MDELVKYEKDVDIRLKAPFTAILTGPTGSGKTILMKKLIKNREYWTTEPPQEIIYCYGTWQKNFEDMENVSFREGLVDVKNDIPDDGKHRWIILDDLMEEVSKSSEAKKIFTMYSHHKNISVYFITQNFYSNDLRTITLNAHYIFFFKNPRDRAQIMVLGKQIFPGSAKRLQESYNHATQRPHSYIFLDLTQNTDDDLRILGGYGDDPEGVISVY